jgi:hypothetical protein
MRASISIIGACKVLVYCGSVEVTDEGIVSVVLVSVLMTRATTASEVDTSEVVVIAIVYVGVSWPVSSL